jgi:hypothetical protein
MKHSIIASLKQVIMGYPFWRPIKLERNVIEPNRIYRKIEQLESFEKLYNMTQAQIKFPLKS